MPDHDDSCTCVNCNTEDEDVCGLSVNFLLFIYIVTKADRFSLCCSHFFSNRVKLITSLGFL